MEAIIWKFSAWIKEIDPSKLKELLESKLIDSGFGLMKFTDYHFKPMGYTGTWVLSESHLAFHTFPEKYSTYVELASCNREMYERFLADPFWKTAVDPIKVQTKAE